jgi:hypothetical protein
MTGFGKLQEFVKPPFYREAVALVSKMNLAKAEPFEESHNLIFPPAAPSHDIFPLH